MAAIHDGIEAGSGVKNRTSAVTVNECVNHAELACKDFSTMSNYSSDSSFSDDFDDEKSDNIDEIERPPLSDEFLIDDDEIDRNESGTPNSSSSISISDDENLVLLESQINSTEKLALNLNNSTVDELKARSLSDESLIKSDDGLATSTEDQKSSVGSQLSVKRSRGRPKGSFKKTVAAPVSLDLESEDCQHKKTSPSNPASSGLKHHVSRPKISVEFVPRLIKKKCFTSGKYPKIKLQSNSSLQQGKRASLFEKTLPANPRVKTDLVETLKRQLSLNPDSDPDYNPLQNIGVVKKKLKKKLSPDASNNGKSKSGQSVDPSKAPISYSLDNWNLICSKVRKSLRTPKFKKMSSDYITWTDSDPSRLLKRREQLINMRNSPVEKFTKGLDLIANDEKALVNAEKSSVELGSAAFFAANVEPLPDVPLVPAPKDDELGEEISTSIPMTSKTFSSLLRSTPSLSKKYPIYKPKYVADTRDISFDDISSVTNYIEIVQEENDNKQDRAICIHDKDQMVVGILQQNQPQTATICSNGDTDDKLHSSCVNNQMEDNQRRSTYASSHLHVNESINTATSEVSVQDKEVRFSKCSVKLANLTDSVNGKRKSNALLGENPEFPASKNLCLETNLCKDYDAVKSDSGKTKTARVKIKPANKLISQVNEIEDEVSVHAITSKFGKNCSTPLENKPKRLAFCNSPWSNLKDINQTNRRVSLRNRKRNSSIYNNEYFDLSSSCLAKIDDNDETYIDYILADRTGDDGNRTVSSETCKGNNLSIASNAVSSQFESASENLYNDEECSSDIPEASFSSDTPVTGHSPLGRDTQRAKGDEVISNNTPFCSSNLNLGCFTVENCTLVPVSVFSNEAIIEPLDNLRSTYYVTNKTHFSSTMIIPPSLLSEEVGCGSGLSSENESDDREEKRDICDEDSLSQSSSTSKANFAPERCKDKHQQRKCLPATSSNTEKRIMKCSKCTFTTTNRFLFANHINRNACGMDEESVEASENEGEFCAVTNSQDEETDCQKMNVCNMEAEPIEHTECSEKRTEDESTAQKLDCAKQELLSVDSKVTENFQSDIKVPLKVSIGKQSFAERFKCNVCGFVTHNKGSLTVHRKLHEGFWYKCTDCSFRCTTKRELELHVKTHEEPPYNCTQCPFTTEYRRCFSLHVNKHISTPFEYRCELCIFSTFSKASLTSHMKRHCEEAVEYKCSLCDYTTSFKSSLTVHIKKHSCSSEEFRCTYCEFTTNVKGALTVHMKRHTVTPVEFYCEFCDYVTHFKSAFTAHKKLHGESVMSCEKCTYVTSCRKDYESHVRSHGNITGLNCPSCTYSASTREEMAGHITQAHVSLKAVPQIVVETCDTNTSSSDAPSSQVIKNDPDSINNGEDCKDEKLFTKTASIFGKTNTAQVRTCPHCTYRSCRVSTFAIHLAEEHEDRPVSGVSNPLKQFNVPEDTLRFWCPLCRFATDSKGMMSNHRRQHSSYIRDKKDRSCPFCGFVFQDSIAAQKHIVVVHAGESRKCEHCSFQSINEKEYSDHCKQHADSKIAMKICPHCDFKAKSQKALKNHIEMHEKDVENFRKNKTAVQKDSVYAPGITFSNNMQENVGVRCADRMEVDTKVEVTGEPLETKYAIDSQSISVSADKKLFSCGSCHFSTLNWGEMVSHTWLHRREKVQDADIDGHTSSYLKKAVGILKKNIYRCKICDYKSFNRQDLTAHNGLHLKGERDLKTPEENSSSLTKIATSSVKSVFRCKQCGYKTDNMHDIVLHAYSHRNKLIAPKLADYEEHSESSSVQCVEKSLPSVKLAVRSVSQKLPASQPSNENGQNILSTNLDCTYNSEKFENTASRPVTFTSAVHVSDADVANPSNSTTPHRPVEKKDADSSLLTVTLKKKRFRTTPSSFRCHRCEFTTSLESEMKSHSWKHRKDKFKSMVKLTNVSDEASNSSSDMALKTSSNEMSETSDCDDNPGGKIENLYNLLTVNEVMKESTGSDEPVLPRLHKCSECDFSTYHVDNLRAHVHVHRKNKNPKSSSWKKVICCVKCGFKTELPEEMKDHVLIHRKNVSKGDVLSTSDGKLTINGEQNTSNEGQETDVAVMKKCNTNEQRFFTCSRCPFMGNSLKELRAHRRENHTTLREFLKKPKGKKRSDDKATADLYFCKYCDYFSWNKGYLVIHERRHTGQGNVQCPVAECNYGTIRRFQLRQHLMNMHGLELDDDYFSVNRQASLKKEPEDIKEVQRRRSRNLSISGVSSVKNEFVDTEND